ncbi:MAG: hypothetical protein ABMA01_07835 [Chthoniobacteraceae bacterium]
MNFRNLITATLLFLSALSADGQKDREKVAPAPPPVISQRVALQRGETVEIPLGIHGVRGEQLQFLIRTPPKSGRLSAITLRGANAAVVKYTAPSKGSVTEDRFAYAVSGSEGVSAPGLVTISIVEPAMLPGKLVAPAELDFPKVVTGERSTVEMELGNTGGGVLEGEVRVPSPWSIEGSGAFRIDPGAKAVMKVVFQSEKPGTFRDDAVLSGPARTIIALRASAEERLVVTPQKLELVAKSGSQTRMGVLRIANRSREPVKIQIAAGSRLMPDRVVTIAARADAEVPVFAEAGDVSEITDAITLSSGTWSVSIPVHASAVEALLRFAAGGRLFEKVTPGEATDSVAKLENLGGKAVSVRLEVDPPFQLRTQTAVVPPNGSVDIPVRLPSVEPGLRKAKLSARAEGQVASVEISADVPAGPVRLAPDIVAAPPVPEVSAKQPDPDAQEAPPAMPATLKEHPNGLGDFARATGPTSAFIDWPVSLGGSVSPLVEQRLLSLSPEDELVIKWARVHGVTFRQQGDRMRAELTGLEPASLHTMRVVTDRGETSEVVFTVHFWTPPKKPLFEINWRLAALIAAAGTFLYLLWRRRKSTSGGW